MKTKNIVTETTTTKTTLTHSKMLLYTL